MLKMGMDWPLDGRKNSSPQNNLNSPKERDAPDRSHHVYTELWCISPGTGLRHHQDATS